MCKLVVVIGDPNSIASFQLIRQGDSLAFESLFREQYPTLCAYAGKFVQDLSASEELVQDLFVKLWEKRESLEPERSVQSYLFRAVHNSCLNYLKHLKVQAAYADHMTHSDQHEDHDPLAAVELQTRIDKVLESLPQECRRVFNLSRFEGLKYKQIAEQLGISVKTVEAQMGKALKRFRTELHDYLTILLIILIKFFN